MKSLLSALFGILPVMCFCQTKEPQMMRIVMQPEVEINKQTDLKIYFNRLPDKGAVQIDSTDDWEIIRENGAMGQNIDTEKYEYLFYTYATPVKLGKIEIPPVSVKIKKVEYKSKPFSVDVVDSIMVDSNSVRTILVADKNTYQLQDTIQLSLYEYSKFSKENKHIVKDTPDINNISISGKGNAINVSGEFTLEDIYGIQNIEKYLDEYFTVADLEWNPFYENQTMEKLDGENYIKTKLFTIYLLANKKGEYEFQPSIFDYSVYRSNDDYWRKFVPNDEGAYTVTNNGAVKLKVISNSVKIEVQ